MTWIVLTFIGCWCIVSAMLGAAVVANNARMSGLALGADVLFSLASIGLPFLLLAERIG